MKIELAERYKILFVIAVALGVYYPSIFGEVNSVDDQWLITCMINTVRLDFGEVFFPGKSLYYYRPILWLSFLFDRFVFNSTESFMHLHNILLHAINGVLVFLVVKEMLRIFNVVNRLYVPMVASLLFLLHPLNTESVNWISGRTDVFAGTFVFLSFLIFLRKGLESYVWTWLSASFYLLGLLTKEAAVGLVPVVGLLLFLKEKPIQSISVRRRLGLLLPFLSVTAVYFLMRGIATGLADTGLSTVTKGAEQSVLLISMSGAVKAFGFYVKKLFLPLPLTFGIIEINRTFYFWFGIMTMIGALYLALRKRSLVSFFFLFAIPFFLPAIPVALSKMAWTPLAERYLYISTFGVSTLVALILSRVPWRRELVYSITVAVLLVAALITVNRNIIWQSNITLYKDSVEKSPNFAAARNEYGVALMKTGKREEALEQFQIALRLSDKEKYREKVAMNIANLSGHTKNPEELKKEYLSALEREPTSKLTEDILQRIIKITEGQIMQEKDPDKKKALYREDISYVERLLELDRNGFYLYRIGQLYLGLGEEKKAAEYFKSSLELSPNEYFSEAARKLTIKLERGKN